MARMRPEPEPAWLDDPTLTVTLAQVRASLDFERGLADRKRGQQAEKDARKPKAEDTRPRFKMKEGS